MGAAIMSIGPEAEHSGTWRNNQKALFSRDWLGFWAVGDVPRSASLFAGGAQQFKAAVSGAVNKSVHWVLNPAVGALSSSGLYTAPLSIASSQEVNVTAVSFHEQTRVISRRMPKGSTVGCTSEFAVKSKKS